MRWHIYANAVRLCSCKQVESVPATPARMPLDRLGCAGATMLSSEAGTHDYLQLLASQLSSAKFYYARLCWWSDDWMVYHLADNTSKEDKRATLKDSRPEVVSAATKKREHNHNNGYSRIPRCLRFRDSIPCGK